MVGFWEQWLPLNSDQILASKVLDYLEHGIPVGFSGEDVFVHTDNWPSAKLHSDVINEFLVTNLQLGVISGPIDPLLENMKISPLGAFAKNGKVRIIHDLSYPLLKSVNCGIDDAIT